MNKSNWHVRKSIIVILTMIIIVPFAYLKVSANTYNANYSLTQYNYFVETSSGTKMATTDIYINLKSPASGTLTVNVSPTASSQYYEFLALEGGVITSAPSTSTSKITVKIESSDHVVLRVRSISTTSNSHLTFTLSGSPTYTNGISDNIENLAADVLTIKGYLGNSSNNVLSVLTTINTTLSNLHNSPDYSTILNSIKSALIGSNTGNLYDAINDLPDYTNQLNTLANILGDISGYVDGVEGQLTTINGNIVDVETLCNTISNTLSSINSTLNNIDNLIDKITWKQKEAELFVYDNQNNQYTENATKNSFYIKLTNLPINNNYIYYFTLPIRYSSTVGAIREIPKITFWYSNDGINFSSINKNIYYYLFTADNTYLKMLIQLGTGTYRQDYVYIKVESSYYYLSYISNYPKTIKYIDPDDIEYWKLLSNLQIESLIKGTSNTIEVENQAADTNTQFQNNSDQYHSVESTFQSNFNTSMQAINPTSILEDIVLFAPAFSWFTQQLGLLYEASGPFKILFTLPLLLGIALFFIGRGVNVFNDPYKDNSYLSETHTTTTQTNINTGEESLISTRTLTTGYKKRTKGWKR